MATTVTLNGVQYNIPAVGEDAWGENVSNYLIALSTGVLTKAGGSFVLAAEVDLGPTYGIKSTYLKSRATNPAATGVVRLANADTGIVFRNAANSADLALTVNSSNVLTFNSANIITAGTGLIVNADISPSAAIDFSKINSVGAIVNADINASAAIAYSKLNLTTSIVNADINASAAIAYSKLNLATSIVNADVSASAAIAYSKLNLATSIVNADVSASAAIAYSKLNLSTSIVNADIGAAAAIAGTKVSPNFGSQNISTTGTATITATTAYIATVTGSNTATDVSYFKFQRQRSGGAIVASADRLGSLQWDGWNGSAYVNAAAITAEIGGAPGASNDMPGIIDFWTTPDGSGTLQRVGRARQNGSWFIGPTAADQASFRGNDIRGVNDGSAAVTGFVGETITLSNATPVSFTTSTQWLEVAAGALALTAGAWSISAFGYFQANGATVVYTQMCVSTATGNNTTGATLGVNITSDSGPTSTFDKSTSIAPYTINISSATNYYLKFRASYSVATPNYTYQITAVRIR